MTPTTVLTGANRGIGLELARQLAAAGERVIATTRDPRAAPELCALDVRVEALDVADARSVARFRETLAGALVDLLINNAGIGVGERDLEGLDVESLARYFQVNSMGALRVTQALLPNLRAGTRKHVAQITSRMGSIADNTSGGAYAYRASKAALNMLTKSLALDLAGEGFVCVVLHPGWVRTRMGGDGAPTTVEESARDLLATLQSLAPEDNGRFLGPGREEIPW